MLAAKSLKKLNTGLAAPSFKQPHNIAITRCPLSTNLYKSWLSKLVLTRTRKASMLLSSIGRKNEKQLRSWMFWPQVCGRSLVPYMTHDTSDELPHCYLGCHWCLFLQSRKRSRSQSFPTICSPDTSAASLVDNSFGQLPVPCPALAGQVAS